MDAVDEARKELQEVVKAPGMVNHDGTAAAAQKVTEARYKYWAERQAVYPDSYPPPDAGDGKAIFEAADEAGEGVMTKKEMSKYIARNQSTLRMLLKDAYQIFADQFQIDDLTDIKADEFMEVWQRAVALRDQELATQQTEKNKHQDLHLPSQPNPAEADQARHQTLPTRSKPPLASYDEMVPHDAQFKFSLGHQEMARVMKELEAVFNSQPCEWLPVDAMGNLLAMELGYEDAAEFEDALGGEFSEFVKGLPNAELSTNERGTQVLKLKKDVMGPHRTMTLKVTDRKYLWHVLMQAPDARITINELEFEFQPMGERRIDT
eukprot:gene20387-31374_t